VAAHVKFEKPFAEPPVVFTVANGRGGDPVTIRVRNVTSEGFTAVLVEPQGEDGPHVFQTRDYMAAAVGKHQLPNGAWMEVGKLIKTVEGDKKSRRGATTTWSNVAFDASFSSAPAFVTCLQTMQSETGQVPAKPSIPWITVATAGLSRSGARVALEMGETSRWGHIAKEEVIGWVAMEPGSGSLPDDAGAPVAYAAVLSKDVVRGYAQRNPAFVPFGANLGAVRPLVVGSQSTRDGGDGGWLRILARTPTGLTVAIDEDQASDQERSHTTERVSIIAFTKPFWMAATDAPATKQQAPSFIAGEFKFRGRTALPTEVKFDTPFEEPPVVFSLANAQGGHPVTIRIRDVTTDGFTAVMTEPLGNDGPHFAQTVGYVAIAKGIHQLPDGTDFEAGSIMVQPEEYSKVSKGCRGLTGSWHEVKFSGKYDAPPVFVAGLQTMASENGKPSREPAEPWLVVATKDLSATGAKVAMDLAEAFKRGRWDQVEEIGYVTMRPSVGRFVAKHGGGFVSYAALLSKDSITGFGDRKKTFVPFGMNLGTSKPVVVGSQSSYDGPNGGWLRLRQRSASGVTLEIDEDVACDAERRHTTEKASILAFSGGFST